MKSTAIYAFVGWIFSIICYLAFLAWAFLPETLLIEYGVTYYPSKYYAIALPAYLIVLYVFIGIFYTSFNMLNTFECGDMRNICDQHTSYFSSQMNKTHESEVYYSGHSNNSESSHIKNASDLHNNYFTHNHTQNVPDMLDIHPAEISRLLIVNRNNSNTGHTDNPKLYK